jgi:DNA-binding response OmpR family regulator
MRPSVLLVNTDRAVLLKLVGLLTEEGYRVATAASFKEARDSLVSIRPDVLVAAVRLGEFNGIGLAIHAHLNEANLPVVITDTTHDSVLEHEAVRFGASYVVNPTENPAFLSNVNMSLRTH